MNTFYKELKSRKTKQNNHISLFGFSSDKNQTLIIGVVHGDEPQGEKLINKYMNTHNKKGILFIPVLNPDGKVANTRVNANGVDLNRNFPTKNWTLGEKDNYFGGEFPASEIETKFLVEVVEEYQPKAIITLHTPYKIVNYDGNAKKLAEKISQIIGYPVEESIGYPTPGSFGTYAGLEKNIPTITLEMDEEENIDNLFTPIEEIFNSL